MLYLKNATWIDPDDLSVSRVNLLVEEGPTGGLRLEFPAPASPEADPASLAPDQTTVLDLQGRYATRAFACGHHHIYSVLSRGMPPSPAPTDTFVRMLEHVWWRLDRHLDRDMVEASALAAAMHCAKCGVTFIIDHHSSPFSIPGSLSTISRAFERVGVGHLLCYEISGRDGPDAADRALAETDAWLGTGRKGHVGLHASFTVDDDLLRHAVALARRHRTGIHIHVAESAEDQAHCLAVYGKRVVRRLADAGALDLPHSLFAHCVHVDEEERGLLRNAPGWVVQNVESNQNNRVGLGHYADLPRVMLGTDGMHGDMLRSMQAVWHTGPEAEGPAFRPDPAIPYRRLRAAHDFIYGMNASGDGANNIVIFDYDTPTPVTGENAAGHFLFGLASRHVRTVIAQGRIIVENHRLVSLDEDAVLALARAQAKRLWTLLRRA